MRRPIAVIPRALATLALYLTLLLAWPIADAPVTRATAAFFNTTWASAGNAWLSFQPHQPTLPPPATTWSLRATATSKAPPRVVAHFDTPLRHALWSPLALTLALCAATPLALKARAILAAITLPAVTLLMLATLILHNLAILAHGIPATDPTTGAQATLHFNNWAPTTTNFLTWADFTLYRSPPAAPLIAALTWATIAWLIHVSTRDDPRAQPGE